MWNWIKQMNISENGEILNVNMLKSKDFLYFSFYPEIFFLFFYQKEHNW